jgi:O-antigen/teichoic acid export membrane protein
MGFVLRAIFGGPAYGLFAVAQSATELAAYFLLGGFNDAIVYHASRHITARDAATSPDEAAAHDERLYRALATCVVPPLLLGLLLALVTPLVLPAVYRLVWTQHDPEIISLMRVLGLGLPLIVVMQLFAESTKTSMQFHWQVGIVQVLFPSLTLLFALGFHYGAGLGIASLAWGLVCGLAVAAPLSVFAFSRFYSLRRFVRAALAFDWDREVMRFALPQSVNMVMNLGLTKVDGLMLSGFVSANAVGIFVLVSDLTQLIRLAKMAFSSVFSPLVARYQAALNREGIEQALHSLVQLTSALGVVLAIGIMGMYEHAILADGETWTHGRVFPWLLCVGPMMSCFFGLAGNLLLMTGHSRLLLYNSMGAGLLNVILNWLFIPHWGLVGAAAATAISNFAISFTQVVEMGRLEGYRYRWSLYRRTVLAAAPPLAGVVFAHTAWFSSVATWLPSDSPRLDAGLWTALMIALYLGLHLLLPGPSPLRDRLLHRLRRREAGP